MFFLLIIGLLIILLIVLALIAFLPEINNKFKNFPVEDTMSIPDVKINFSIIDSQQTQNLQLFKTIESEFTYTARNSAGRQVSGRISATTIEEAGALLQNMGLSAYTLEQVTIGRKDPFASY